ncbi:branched-chain amino acid ABC transporter permease [Deinococcus metallilatus]|uniref:4-azaleucine resistance transporter AzlC n=1 Tax=Deinococcus metallilatus TaxID=1211322 RepID=A0AAJ5F2T8_9DEIO|nr:AzlC family ABC transporter permease [Deinococcus metallilatus]MBB5295544.1 4-azaleucine resistance transporter AzlC [Deinococcus metallilatus]QBY07942.1 branched-chain amino acid ABC transporter permease [Deinococcus metallilatus]RXJ12835.1 branched-chain amino acid ABC transporter permease [Deinococcus metallilatus]TLK27243.1 AzlC family ABC transporter permease [Deinococcus metallilatus]GMA16222.1 branched-chain amino acid permease [Deinococcus metallilatus]
MTPFWPAFWRGFRALVPLWLGVIPFAVAYAVTARAAGLSVRETQLMSLTVFAGASQFAAAGLFAGSASAWGIVATTFLLNARHVLYGLSLARQVPLTRPQRVLAAQFLTDEAYGVAVVNGVREPGGLSFGFLLGAELSLYAVWNVATFAGALAGGVLPDPAALGVGVIFPLAFLGLLVPLLIDRKAVLVALASGLGAWGLARVLPGGLVVLLAGVGGALLGAWLVTRKERA